MLPRTCSIRVDGSLQVVRFSPTPAGRCLTTDYFVVFGPVALAALAALLWPPSQAASLRNHSSPYHWTMDIDLFTTWHALPRLLQGAAVTLEVSVAAMALGLLLATALTILRESGNGTVRVCLGLYIGYIRGTPLLVQILLVYYGLPQLGLGISPLPAAILALARPIHRTYLSCSPAG